MTWRTGGPAVLIRDFARSIGATRMLGRFLKAKGYEEKFQERMLGLVRQGHTVWDIGANVGLYTRQFAALVGRNGQVVAIEPNPSALRTLEQSMAGLTNVKVLALGLGSRSGRLTLDVGDGPHSTSARIMDTGSVSSEDLPQIDVATGDSLVGDQGIGQPNLIKIDTEGYELDVLRGMAGILGRKALHAVCVEVHFGLLSARGISNAPAEIEKLLSQAGFSIEWTDPSHLVATRG